MLAPTTSEAFINQLLSQVRMMESQLVRFCLEQCPMNGFRFDFYAAIVGQSSSVVGPGEEIKITAGIGAFSRNGEPLITFDGKPIQISDDGAAYCQFKAPTKVGRYTIPTNIEFSDREGKRQSIHKIVEYSVVRK